MNIRVNNDLKIAFTKCCKSKGYTPSKVITLFAINYVQTGTKPFSLGEITNADENLKPITISIDDELKLQFSAACEKYDKVKMSTIIRTLMCYCVKNDCLPF